MKEDFNPDVHPPIHRTHCLATAWFDDDPMPAVCCRENGHGGGHVANTRSAEVYAVGPAPAWTPYVVVSR